MLDDRAKLLLKALVERYIADGQPVGSRTLSRASGLELSPATIRNVMSDLEELGLIVSPHTSAGRIPTARGYRLFVDTMLTVQRGQLGSHSLAPDQPQKVISNAANLLSSLSQFVGVVIAPRRSSVFHHIEFLRLSERRVLVIIVSPEGDVQNRVIFTETDHTQAQLVEAANFLNANYVGLAIEQVRERLKSEVDSLRAEIASLMNEFDSAFRKKFQSEDVKAYSEFYDETLKLMKSEDLKKLIAQTRKSMEKAARDLDFIEAARLRDEMYELEKLAGS